MRRISCENHRLNQVAFVDAWVPHCTIYPAELTITYALWSGGLPTSWKDRLKRMPLLKQNEAALRKLVGRLGLTRALELKVVEDFDYCPVEGGFRNLRERIEFELGPNQDHLQSLFHIVQRTGNAALAPIIEAQAEQAGAGDRVRELLGDLAREREIGPRLSRGHFDVPHANFTTGAIERSLLPAR
jgi:hypothetical protein